MNWFWVSQLLFSYLKGMFVRKKKNKSGKVSIQVIDKSSGKYKVVKTIGSSKDSLEIDALYQKGYEWIRDYLGIMELDFNVKTTTNEFLDSIKSITVSGTDLLLNQLHNEIGFNKLGNEVFRYLVFSRIIFPASKLKTTELLLNYQDIHVNVQKIYRYLDELYKNGKEKVQQISYKHTLLFLLLHIKFTKSWNVNCWQMFRPKQKQLLYLQKLS